jgi:hypothetical protein
LEFLDHQFRRALFAKNQETVPDTFSSFALDDFIPDVLEQLASCEVANRPDRIEPRVLKRRRQGYKLMTKPRDVLKAELLKKCT